MRPGTSLALLFLASGCGKPAPDTGPCRSAPLTKGPWVMRADSQGASIFWETAAAPSCVAAGITPEAGGAEIVIPGAAVATTVTGMYNANVNLAPDLPGTYYLARVDAAALPAGTCYGFRVRAGAAPSDGGVGGDAPDATGRFCTARPVDLATKLTFFAIGDTNPILGHTIPVLNHTLPEKPDLLIHMGDIHYYSSTETWAYWFGKMAPMLRAGAFYPAVGNHEGFANTDPAGDYVDYYARLFHAPSLDGVSTDKLSYYRFSSGGVWFHTIDTEEPYDSASNQYQWLQKSLKDAQSTPGFRFSVVYMHRNLYTLGDADPNVDVRKALTPLFESTKVRLVVSGHMHGYERFEVADITYVTTGGGGGTINDVNKNVANYPADVPLRVLALPAYHAMLFDVSASGPGSKLHGRAIDEFGAVIDEFTHPIP